MKVDKVSNQITKLRSESPSGRKVIKRSKEVTPNAKASRKKYRRDLEGSIKKVAKIYISPTKTGSTILQRKDPKEDVVSMEKHNEEKKDGEEKEDGAWCHCDELDTLSYNDINHLVDDAYNLIFGTVYSNYDQNILEKGSNDEEEKNLWVCPEDACPIWADVRTFDFKRLATFVNDQVGRKFDIIMMDPPWKFTTANPTRGVSIRYSCLDDNDILNMGIDVLQTDGFLFIWVINSKMDLAMNMFKKWNYKVVDGIEWLKMTVNRRIASGHGYYLQHAFETCLIGLKGNVPPGYNHDCNIPDIIYEHRRAQSQKPIKIYEVCEEMVKDGLYLEIFGRRYNSRGGWMTMGNEI